MKKKLTICWIISLLFLTGCTQKQNNKSLNIYDNQPSINEVGITTTTPEVESMKEKVIYKEVPIIKEVPTQSNQSAQQPIINSPQQSITNQPTQNIYPQWQTELTKRLEESSRIFQTLTAIATDISSQIDSLQLEINEIDLQRANIEAQSIPVELIGNQIVALYNQTNYFGKTNQLYNLNEQWDLLNNIDSNLIMNSVYNFTPLNNYTKQILSYFGITTFL